MTKRVAFKKVSANHIHKQKNASASENKQKLALVVQEDSKGNTRRREN
jgi:hypothetical protein